MDKLSVEKYSSKHILNLDKLIDESLNYTNKLSFAYKNNLNENKANCVGYSYVFSHYFNYLSIKNKLPYTAYQTRGYIYLLRFNLNKLSNVSFFKNHDFIEIKNTKTNKTIHYIDPSLYDYFGVKYVRKY